MIQSFTEGKDHSYPNAVTVMKKETCRPHHGFDPVTHPGAQKVEFLSYLQSGGYITRAGILDNSQK